MPRSRNPNACVLSPLPVLWDCQCGMVLRDNLMQGSPGTQVTLEWEALNKIEASLYTRVWEVRQAGMAAL